MRRNTVIITLIILAGFFQPASSQKFNAGFYSGINFSDIQGQNLDGKWRSIPGPVTAFRFGYDFNEKLGLQTGIDLLSVFYEHLSYNSYSGTEFYLSSLIAPYYDPLAKTDFSFLRFPLLFRYSVPGIIKLDIKTGLLYSRVQDYSLNLPSYYSQPKPAMHDIAYCFSAGLSYQLAGGFTASLSYGYMAGTEKILPEMKYRHGSSEFVFGISYDIFNKDRNKNVENKPDTTDSRLSYTLIGGMNVSGNLSSKFRDKYSSNTGTSVGFTVNYSLSENTSLRIGALFESKGYSLSDSSTSFFRYVQTGDLKYNVDTKTDIDYFTFPVLFDFRLGSRKMIFIQAGPYVSYRMNAHCSGEAFYTARSLNDYRLIKKTVSDDIEGRIKKMDCGFQLGGGVSVPLKNITTVDLNISWRSGIMDVVDDSVFNNNYDRKNSGTVIKNGTLSFNIGIKIPQKG